MKNISQSPNPVRRLAITSLAALALGLGLACSTADPGLTPSGSGGAAGAGGVGGTADATGGSGVGGSVGSGGDHATGGSAGSGGTAAGTGGTTEGSGGGSGGVSHSVGLLSGTAHYNCDEPEGAVPELQLTPYVTSGLDLPIYLTHAPDDTSRLFVLEQAGKIKIVEAGVVKPNAFLDITAKVSMDPWEQGLLGLAFHPKYAENGLFYVHYSAKGVSGHPDQANIVAEYHVSASDPNVAEQGSERIILSVDTDRTGEYLGYHNGGSILFGMNDELFIALGDGAGRGPGEFANNSQNLNSLRGKLLRINPLAAGDEPYSIPPGNMADTTANVAPEIWSYGLRNPYRTNMDPCTGDIYIGDVGHFDWEEVNVEPAGSGHHNYGWPVLEGDDCLVQSCTEPAAYRGPVLDYAHDGGSGAVIGGVVYRGSAIPGLRGTYFFSDLYGGTRVFSYDKDADEIVMSGSVEEETNANQEQQTLVAIQSGGDGEIYFVSRGGSVDPNGPVVGESTIYKLEPYVP